MENVFIFIVLYIFIMLSYNIKESLRNCSRRFHGDFCKGIQPGIPSVNPLSVNSGTTAGLSSGIHPEHPPGIPVGISLDNPTEIPPGISLAVPSGTLP